MVDIDSETLFNGAAAIVTTIAVLFFILNVEYGYSPVSKTALVVLFLAGIFTITQATDDRQLTLLGYGVIVTASVGLFFDLVNTFNVDSTLTVLGLLLIAAVLFSVRTRLDEENHFVTAQQAKYLLAAVAVLAIGLLAVDVVTGGLQYELHPSSEIEIPAEQHTEIRVASVIVTNPTPLPERVDTPRYRVCTAGNWSAYRPPSREGEPQRDVRADVHVEDGYNEHVMGLSSKSYPVRLHLDGANLEGETFPVQRTTTCPETETGPPYLAIFEAPEQRTNVRPV